MYIYVINGLTIPCEILSIIQINKTLIDMHDNMPPDRWLNDTEIHVLLSIICDESFIR